MISKQEYDEAVAQRSAAQAIINQYGKEQRERFVERLQNNPVFTEEELIYSAMNRCPCGHGLAYPDGCGIDHYWDCSAILKGIHGKGTKHTAQLLFSMYNIKSENQPSAKGATTRGVIIPKE